MVAGDRGAGGGGGGGLTETAWNWWKVEHIIIIILYIDLRLYIRLVKKTLKLTIFKLWRSKDLHNLAQEQSACTDRQQQWEAQQEISHVIRSIYLFSCVGVEESLEALNRTWAMISRAEDWLLTASLEMSPRIAQVREWSVWRPLGGFRQRRTSK